jgi:hypothetical protein
MAIFTISDNTIDILKKKLIWMFILTSFIIMISTGIIMISTGVFSYFSMQDINIEKFIIFFIFWGIISLALFFRIKYELKFLEKEMKSIQYIIENEKLIIMKNEFIQYIYKNEIKCINKYENSMILITLNIKQEIIVNKYLDNFDQLIDNLNILSPVNNINRNQNIVKRIWVSIIQSLRESGF